MFQRLKVLGATRLPYATPPVHGTDLRVIDNTTHAEDLHYHEPSGLIFTAAERDETRRSVWFPPANAPKGEGGLVVIDPKTSRSSFLELIGFGGCFVTHGIDIYSEPSEPTVVYILAVNHVPRTTGDSTLPKAYSKLELFRHTIGSTSATHLRSVWHPLIRTPNDVLMVSPTEFWVTNDHYYREGLSRLFEDMGMPGFAAHTDTVHVVLSTLEASNDEEGVTATVASKGYNTNNGLGYGKSRDEILIGLAAAGLLKITKRAAPGSPVLEEVDEIQFDTSIDNPSYFHDPYAESTGSDASGYVIAGLLKAITLPDDPNPSVVWHVKRSADGKGWEKNVIFQDDGSVLSSASTGVLVPIDPKENAGKKQARLVIAGPVAKAVVACTIDL